MPKFLRVLSEKPYELKLFEAESLEADKEDLQIKVEYSCLNYKDALALTGKGKILRSFPLIPGIDASGEVIESCDSHFPVGSKILVNGSGFGETRDGGFSSHLNAPASLLVSQTGKIDSRMAMVLGTAGFTAALALHRMLENHQDPGKGPILISGATGGVGSIACILFSQRGFEVHALSSKKQAESEYLMSLGASEVIHPDELNLSDAPLSRANYAGLVDNIGGGFLSKILANIDLFGNVASIGLASGHEINASVMPFILRGVSLLGISSANTPIPLRREIWRKLGEEWYSEKFNLLKIRETNLESLESCATELLSGSLAGRFLVKL